MFSLFFMALAGFILRRWKVFDQKSDAVMTQLSLSLAMPAAFLTGVAGAEGAGNVLYLAYVIGLSLLMFLLFCAISYPAVWLMRPPKGDVGALASTAIFPNMAFMGFPVLLALYGQQGLFYGVLISLPFNVLALSAGIKILAGSAAKMSLRLIFNVSMNASLLGIALFALDIQIPPVINTPLVHLGNMFVPLGMVLLGSILGGIEDLKSIFSGWRVYAITAVRLLLIPVVTYLLFAQFISNPILLRSILIVSAAPSAIRTAMLSLHFGGNPELVSQGITISSIFCLITIPLLMLLFGV